MHQLSVTLKVVSISYIGQNVSAWNFCAGPLWSVGVIVEILGRLTYLIQVTTGVS